MPAPSDPQATPPTPDTPGPAESTGPGAGKLLDEIRERLERLEGNLSLRERRVARLERTLRDADGKLQSERARYAAERESIEKGLPQQLQEREQQLEAAERGRQELEGRLAAQTAREREMRERIEKLTAERDQAAAYLKQAQRETQEVQRSQRELEAQLEDLARRRGEWERIATAPAPTRDRDQAIPADLPKWLLPVLRLVRGWRALPTLQRVTVATTLCVLPIVCVVAAVTAYRHYPRTYRVEGCVAAPAEASALLARFERPASESSEPAFDRIDIRRQEPAPLLVTSMLVRERTPDRAIGQVDAELNSILRQLISAMTAPATQPERQMLHDQLRQELERYDARMAALTTQPADGPADPRALLAAWQKLLDERKGLDAAIAQLDAKLQQPPPGAADVKVTPEQLAAALAADPRLLADSEVLTQRETELAGIIRKGLDAAGPSFANLTQSAAAADKYFEVALSESGEQDAKEAMQVVRNAISNCAKAGAAMSKVWQEERQALDAAAPGLDVSARYKNIETAARDFVGSTDNSLAQMRKSLDAISSGGDNSTKRQILRVNIAKETQPALDARDALAAAARRLTPGENVELATLAQQAGGLRAQVQDRRGRLEQILRDQALADLRAAHESDAQQTRARRDEMARKAAGMEAEIIRGAEQSLALLGGSQTREAALAELVQLTRNRPEVAGKLAAIERTTAEESAEARRLGKLSCRPATAMDLTSPSTVAWCTLAGGMMPILLLAVVAGSFWAVRTWRRPRASLDEYAKALSSLPRRAQPKSPARR